MIKLRSSTRKNRTTPRLPRVNLEHQDHWLQMRWWTLERILFSQTSRFSQKDRKAVDLKIWAKLIMLATSKRQNWLSRWPRPRTIRLSLRKLPNILRTWFAKVTTTPMHHQLNNRCHHKSCDGGTNRQMHSNCQCRECLIWKAENARCESCGATDIAAIIARDASVVCQCLCCSTEWISNEI